MGARLGSLKQGFDERSRERLLPVKEYESGFADESDYDQENERAKCGCFRWLCGRNRGGGIFGCCKKCKEFMDKLFKMGRSDPRKFYFAMKMGLTLALVSCLIFWKNPKEDLTKYSIWSILTVVVCFEFSVGASLSKGFNRGLGTVIAGGLAFGIAELASQTGDFTEPFIILAIFIAGFSASYIKLHPMMKAYEYGFRVFLLTYCIVMVTGNRTTNFFHTALFRLFHILIGASVASIVNICIFPIWAGEDLHKLVVKNFKGVATSLEGCVNGYLQCVAYERIPSLILTYQAYDDPLYGGYRTAVQSTTQEETLMDFAKWEPPHGPYRSFNYPWQHYVRVSGALRNCAFMVMALHGCVLSEIQASAEKRKVFAKELRKVGTAGAKVLLELGSKVEKMEKLSPGDILAEVHEAAEELQMKIDKKSYILVHAENWDEGARRREFEDPEHGIHIIKECGCDNQVVIDSLSEAGQSYEPENTFLSTPTGRQAGQSYEPENTFLSTPTGRPRSLFSSGSILNRTQWPSRLSIQPEFPINEQEAKTFESASSLSLATFASILVEFVARLGYLVKAFEELSEIAHFKEPTD